MYLDIFIIVVMLYALWKGWSNGFLKELVSLLGFIVGLVIACMFYAQLGKYLSADGSSLNILTSIVAFFVIWIIVPIALGTVATVITKVLNRLGAISLPNRLGGMAVSVAKYLLLMSLVLSAMHSLGILSRERQESSHLFEPVTSVTGLLARSVMSSIQPRQVQNDTITSNDTIWVEVNH